MADLTPVHSQITDSVTQANTITLGSGPAAAALPLYASLSEATSVLFANMVASQQQTTVVGNSSLIACVERMLNAPQREKEGRESETMKKVLEMLNEMDRRRTLAEAASHIIK